MKTLFLFIILLFSTSVFAQLNVSKYLITGDSILTFTSQYENLEIIVMDSTVVDTVVLEKKTFESGWANVSVLSNVTGAVVVSMIPGAGVNGATFFLEKFGQGYFRLRMTDGGDAVARKTRVKVIGR